MVLVPDAANGGRALEADEPLLPGRHAQERVAVVLLGEQRHGRAGGARDLPAGSGAELDVVDGGSDWDGLKRERVSGENPRPLAGGDDVANLERRHDGGGVVNTGGEGRGEKLGEGGETGRSAFSPSGAMM